MPTDQGKQYLIKSHYNLIEQLEAIVVRRLNSKVVKDFIQNKLIQTYSIPSLLIVNRRPEFKKEVKIVYKELRIQRIVVSIYNLRANSIIKGSYFSLASTLAKLTNSIRKGQIKLQGPALFTKQTTIRASYSQMPFHLVRGYKLVVLLEISTLLQRIINQLVNMST